ncbi:MAG: hypothetical protein NZ843_06175 [Fimbriimonadales bacterium]|nr:hypothetical protein [Fimbriimonadales bacterium]
MQRGADGLVRASSAGHRRDGLDNLVQAMLCLGETPKPRAACVGETPKPRAACVGETPTLRSTTS